MMTTEQPTSSLTTAQTSSHKERSSAGSSQPPIKRARGLWAEIWRWSLILIGTLVVAVGLLGISLIAAIYWQSRSTEAPSVDAIIVLGTAQYDGRPSPALKARLDATLDAWNAGLAPVVIVTGGKMEGDRFTEAEASRDYLIEHGVPESAILMESTGRSSWESMQGAAEVLTTVGGDRVLVVSDGFHLFRLKVMARDLGLNPYGWAATGGPIRQGSMSEFSYVLREAAATTVFLLDQLL
jgi:uncharacterized SAM-binding protein YcdF (DUF218 family)